MEWPGLTGRVGDFPKPDATTLDRQPASSRRPRPAAAVGKGSEGTATDVEGPRQKGSEILRYLILERQASEAAARITRTNARYVEMVKEISRSVPELLDRVRSGSMTVAEAQRIAASEVRRNGHHRKHGKAKADDAERVTCGDCLDLIPRLDNRSVDLVLCSPPYAEQRRSHYKGVSEATYAKWTVRWMGLLREKLTHDGSVLLVIRPHLKKGVLADYVLRTRLALREDGWSENEELIWLKPDAPPLGSTNRPRRTWESILWFSKTANPYCNLTACGRESTRIGFLPSLRFGLGHESIYNGQKVELRTGKARCSDVFVAPVEASRRGSTIRRCFRSPWLNS